MLKTLFYGKWTYVGIVPNIKSGANPSSDVIDTAFEADKFPSWNTHGIPINTNTGLLLIFDDFVMFPRRNIILRNADQKHIAIRWVDNIVPRPLMSTNHLKLVCGKPPPPEEKISTNINLPWRWHSVITHENPSSPRCVRFILIDILLGGARFVLKGCPRGWLRLWTWLHRQ